MGKIIKILLLEDNEADVDLLQRELKKSGMEFTLRVVMTRNDYVRELEGFCPDIVLSDHSLPSFNSMEAYSILKEQYAIPFILTTGTVSEEFAVECMKAGISDYILKSSLKRLPTAIHTVLANNEVIREKKLVESLNAKLKTAFREIAEKNKNITDSITYAKRIQDAMLPETHKLDSAFPEWFIFNQAKDIVSGDFYWFEKSEDKIIIAVADCTGHGVPGALMSVIGTSLLNKIVNEKHIVKPAEILQQMNFGINHFFKQSDTRDGMDIALCSIDLASLRVEYAGANRPILIVRKDGLEEITPTKLPIGGLTDTDRRAYETKEIQLEPEDKIYFFTDGIIDQFGGPFDKKLMKKRLKEFFTSVCGRSMSEQKSLLKDFIIKWAGHNEQIDDMLVAGLKIR